MKKIFLIASLFIAGTAISNAQILNGSFEDWVSYTGAGISGEYPMFWQTSDSLYQTLFAPHSAIREATDKCDQLFSLELISVSAFGNHAPGVATNGRVVSLTVIDKGTADTTRYQRLTGCYKYTGVGTDFGRISAFLLKWNSTTQGRDTIASSVTITNTTTGITNFSTDFVYRDLYKPDTFLIVMQSSPGFGVSTDGSTLIIDNLALSGWVGIDEATALVKSVKLFPLPVANELQVEMVVDQAGLIHYEIADVTGKKIVSDRMQSEKQKIDVSKLSPGNYLFNLLDQGGQLLYSGKFSVSR